MTNKYLQLQQRRDQPNREWSLVEPVKCRSGRVLLMRERHPTPIHLGRETEMSGIRWIPALSAPVPEIQVKFKSSEGGGVVIQYESRYIDETKETIGVPVEKPKEKPAEKPKAKPEAKKEERKPEWGPGVCAYYCAADVEMQKWGELPPNSSQNLGHKIVKEQEHEPSEDLNLLIAACRFDSEWTVNVPEGVDRALPHPMNAIYKQKSPLGNTLLHIAASRGNNGMVETVAQHAPNLFISRNSNDDTALHVAARAGHDSTIRTLFNAYLRIARSDSNYISQSAENIYSNEEFRMDKYILDLMVILSLTLFQNNQGNTFLHEAFACNSQNGVRILEAFEASFVTGSSSSQFEAEFKALVLRLALFALNKEEKSLLYLAIEVGCRDVVNRLMDICIQYNLEPRGKSPLLPPIAKRHKVMLETILSKKPNWIHLKDEAGRFPLHAAAFLGYREGVSYLVKKCTSCTIVRDKIGFFPLHLASHAGHVEVVQELLKWCLEFPTEMLDGTGQNILHIAAESGKYKVVSYILQQPELENMINERDKNGNTPLHLATRYSHPIIVHALTWDKRVNLALLNHQHQTAMDIALRFASINPSLPQRLTWIALHSAGTSRHLMKVPRYEAHITGQFKDRVETLIVVSTLIITASFTGGLTVPGNVEKGMAVWLNHQLFQLFIFCITFSMFGATSTTVVLIWARLQDLRLALVALKFALPFLGITLASLSLAFLAGVYLVVSKLSWFATTILVMGVLWVFGNLLLYIPLWLPSASTSPIIRYLSYYPFLVLARLAEGEN